MKMRVTIRSAALASTAFLLIGAGAAQAQTQPPTQSGQVPDMASPNGERVFGTVQVEGAQSVDPNGFGQGAGANGSSDATATEGTGSLTTNGATVGTRPPQALHETTQSISVVTDTQIKAQNLNNIADVMQSMPGVAVAPRGVGSAYVSRGFAIRTYTVDGGAAMSFPGAFVGQEPASNTTGAGGSIGSADMAQYDHVELLRGSDALYGGRADPGGTINLQRKRPLDHAQLLLNGQGGSWNYFRIDADATGPIAFDGHLRARVVGAHQQQDFFYDRADQTRNFIYGVLEGDLGPNTILRAGGSYQEQHDTGFNAAGLPRFANGVDLKLPRSTNLSAPWSYNDSKTREAFAALEHQFSEKWRFDLTANYLDSDVASLLNYVTGPVLTPGATASTVGDQYVTVGTEQYAVDGHITGAFSLFGRDQTFVLGASYQQDNNRQTILATGTGFPPVDLYNFDPAVFGPAPAIPTQDTAYLTSIFDTKAKQYSLYGSLALEPTEGLRINAGLSLKGYNNKTLTTSITNLAALGPPFDQPPFNVLFVSTEETKQKVDFIANPSASISYDVFEGASVYASYNRLYNLAAAQITESGAPLPPLTGNSYQAGFKFAGAGGKSNFSIAFFHTEQNNFPVRTSTGTVTTCCWIAAGGKLSTGFELEASGEILPHWQIQGGYVYTNARYTQSYQDYIDRIVGETSVSLTQQPKHQIKLFTQYEFQNALSGLIVHAAVRFESARRTVGKICTLPNDPGTCRRPDFTFAPFENFSFAQGSYGVGDVGASYDITENVRFSVNVTNVTNTKYYAVTGTTQYGNFYGEPRKVIGAVRMKF